MWKVEKGKHKLGEVSRSKKRLVGLFTGRYVKIRIRVIRNTIYLRLQRGQSKLIEILLVGSA